MASQKGGPQTRRQPWAGLLRQVQNLKADEEGDQTVGIEAGIAVHSTEDTDFTNTSRTDPWGAPGATPAPTRQPVAKVRFVPERGCPHPRDRKISGLFAGM